MKYRASVADPDDFWRGEAQRIDWIRPFSEGQGHLASTATISASAGSRTARSTSPPIASTATCPQRAHDVAIIWEPDDPAAPGRTITYRELHDEVCRFANALQGADGVKRGDRVTIYLPMVPEAAVAMLACARIGAVHSIVFAGFSPDALAGRIADCAQRRSCSPPTRGCAAARQVPLKANVDAALREGHGPMR